MQRVSLYTAPSEKNLRKRNLRKDRTLANVEKYNQWLQRCRRQYGSVFIRLAVVASEIYKIREILRKFELIAVHGHPRSSILVSIESAYATFY